MDRNLIMEFFISVKSNDVLKNGLFLMKLFSLFSSFYTILKFQLRDNNS